MFSVNQDDVPAFGRETNIEYTAIVKHTGEWWIGWIEEVPGVNCQGRTLETMRQSLAETLSEALDFDRREAGRNNHWNDKLG